MAPPKRTGNGSHHDSNKENQGAASVTINQQRTVAPVPKTILFTPTKRSAIDGATLICNQEEAEQQMADASHQQEPPSNSNNKVYGMAGRARQRQQPKKAGNNNLNPHFARMGLEATAAHMERAAGAHNEPMSND